MKLLKITTSVDYSFRSGFGIILNLTYSNDQLRGNGHPTTDWGWVNRTNLESVKWGNTKMIRNDVLLIKKAVSSHDYQKIEFSSLANWKEGRKTYCNIQIRNPG